MRYVYIEMRGAIPRSLLELLRLEYGTRVMIRAEGLERMRDVMIAPLVTSCGSTGSMRA